MALFTRVQELQASRHGTNGILECKFLSKNAHRAAPHRCVVRDNSIFPQPLPLPRTFSLPLRRGVGVEAEIDVAIEVEVGVSFGI
jgi:hypothetical protein